MPLGRLRTRLFVAMGLPLGVGNVLLGSCAPPEPANSTPPPTPVPDDAAPSLAEDVSLEASWSLEIDPDLDGGASDARASGASDSATSAMVPDAGGADAQSSVSVKTWYTSYKLAPGTEKWCEWGSTMCQEAGHVQGALNTEQKFGCPRLIQVDCPCSPAGCNPGAKCTAPVYGPVTLRERRKAKNACCYDMPRQCVPPWVGRPLRDDAGDVLCLATEARSDWCLDLDVTELTGASADTRRERARVWGQVASLEHASVASFLRVALQLLSLGARPELLLATHEAAKDEIAHARLAFTVASASGEAVGPAPLPREALLVPTGDLSDLAGETFRDGCVQETLGVLVARDLLDQESSPTLRRVLTRIIEDEERHAELAWRTVAWAVRTGGPAVRSRLSRELERALAETEPDSRRDQVLCQLIEPCLRALLATFPAEAAALESPRC